MRGVEVTVRVIVSVVDIGVDGSRSVQVTATAATSTATAATTAPTSQPRRVRGGGAGTPAHFAEAFAAGASGALAASVFHDRRIAIPDLKTYLADHDIEVRR